VPRTACRPTPGGPGRGAQVRRLRPGGLACCAALADAGKILFRMDGKAVFQNVKECGDIASASLPIAFWEAR
jgi:hypothetical protein